jgi:hypothetical protein
LGGITLSGFAYMVSGSGTIAYQSNITIDVHEMSVSKPQQVVRLYGVEFDDKYALARKQLRRLTEEV